MNGLELARRWRRRDRALWAAEVFLGLLVFIAVVFLMLAHGG